MELTIEIGYADEHGEWVATIIDGDTIIDIGCELTETAACAWGARALSYHADLTDDYPADMYDRLGSVEIN